VILSEIRDYLRSRRQASLADIAIQVDADPDAVRAMVEVWIRKGLVTRLPPANGCGTQCRQCEDAQTEIFAWGESQNASTDIPSCDRR